MASRILQGMRVAILVSDGFEETELSEPERVLETDGAATFVISPMEDKVKGWSEAHVEKQLPVDIRLKSAKPADFHALLLPGGTMSVSNLRSNPEAVQFVKHFVEMLKPVAAIGEGPSLIVQTGAVSAKAVTSAPALKSELEKAGAKWVDEEVVCDGNVITSRTLADLSAFSREMVRVFAEVREHSTDMRKIY